MSNGNIEKERSMGGAQVAFYEYYPVYISADFLWHKGIVPI